MTALELIARRKLSSLELANDLEKASMACKIACHFQEQIYQIRPNLQTFGAEGLVDQGGASERMVAQVPAPSRTMAARKTVCTAQCGNTANSTDTSPRCLITAFW
jgi:hypothetical protein